MISIIASSPASLCARSITTETSPMREEVHPARVVLGVGAERRQPGDDVLAVDAGGQGRRGRREGVLDVEAGQPAQGHGYVDHLDAARRRGCPRGR